MNEINAQNVMFFIEHIERQYPRIFKLLTTLNETMRNMNIYSIKQNDHNMFSVFVNHEMELIKDILINQSIMIYEKYNCNHNS